MSHSMTKPTKGQVCSAKTQISLGIHPLWSESSLCAQWVAKDPRYLYADSADSDQTGRMPRMIWVFTGHTSHLLVLSCFGSNVLKRLATLVLFPFSTTFLVLLPGGGFIIIYFLKVEYCTLPSWQNTYEPQPDKTNKMNLRWAHSHFVGFVMRWLIYATWKQQRHKACSGCLFVFMAQSKPLRSYRVDQLTYPHCSFLRAGFLSG